MPLEWSKTLSKTDAQRRTGGYPVPYLRFTRSRHSADTQRWFRQVFFSGQSWRNGHFGESAVEIANVSFNVTILGVRKGLRVMMVTHDYDRCLNNNTPNTYLHYDEETRAELQAQDLSGHRVSVKKNDAGRYYFEIV